VRWNLRAPGGTPEGLSVQPAAGAAPKPEPAVIRGLPERRARAGDHFRPDIQGLRAVAVVLVVASHAGIRRLSGGYVGVDVFFVISGFVVTSLLLRELFATGDISIPRFYARRALRILPASTLVVLVTLAGAWLFLSKIRIVDYTHDAVASALYVVNFRLAATGSDYLAQSSPPSPFQHFWSLAVEEQFYLLWPVLLLVGWIRGRRRALVPALLVGAVCVVSFALSVATTTGSPSWAYFGAHTRMWELGLGSLLALGADHLRRIPATASAALTWIGLACIGSSALSFNQVTPYPGYHALLPTVGAALVVGGGCSPAPLGAGLLLARRPVTWIGDLSYGWYLWHWPLLIIGPMALTRHLTVRLAVVLSAAALLLAWVSLHLVENPLRFHRKLRARPRLSLSLGLGLSAVAAAAGLVASAFPPAISSGVPAPDLTAALAGAPDPRARLTQFLETAGTRLPSNLTPPLDKVKGNTSVFYRDGCQMGYAGTQTPSCVYGDRSSDTTVVLFGDSHAAQWFPAMDRLARQYHWKLAVLSKVSCKVAAVTIINSGGPYTACDAWRAKALARIGALRPALVIAASSDAGNPAHSTGDSPAQWTTGYEQTFRQLTATGARVTAILDTPWPKADAVDCAAAHPLGLGHCEQSARAAVRNPSRGEALRAAASRTGVSVIDPEPWFCPPVGNCPVAVGNTMIYRDDSHMSESYSGAIAPVLGRRLTALYGADLCRHTACPPAGP
jgi:peptidoglycan/LPS O-acetylase OafA/YrhL